MKTKFYVSILSIAFCFASGLMQAGLHAQGCVAVRQMGGNTMCTSTSYFIPKGEFRSV